MNRHEELGGPILRSVSRSFYLTIRVLPPALRDPIGLAYLLARTSDTIADSSDAPAEVRLAHLADFERAIVQGETDEDGRIAADLAPPSDAERRLLTQIPPMLRWLATIPEAKRKETQDVLVRIIRGQRLDIERFHSVGGHDQSTLISLRTAAELEEYTYLVAGCVGEFWTNICLSALPRYATIPVAQLRAEGILFGKGLQLVNILRDLPEDLKNGRCYLPEDELRATGASPEALLSAPESAQPVFDKWLRRATECLDGGRTYICALRSARLRVACFLPWHIGTKTLDLLAATSPIKSPQRIKVPRSTVRKALLLAPLAAMTDWPMRQK